MLLAGAVDDPLARQREEIRVLVELKLAGSWQICLIIFAIAFSEWMFHTHFETAFQDSRSQKACSRSSYVRCHANLTLRTIYKFPKIV